MAPAKTRARVGREKGVPSPQSSTTRVLRKTTSRLTRSQSQGVEDAEEQVSLGRLRTRRGGPTIVENDKTSAKQRSGTGKGKRGGTVAYKRKRRKWRLLYCPLPFFYLLPLSTHLLNANPVMDGFLVHTTFRLVYDVTLLTW